IATLDLPDGWAIGTSGDYQRYFMLGNKRYCHIIDPRTGYPASHTQAVTVLVPPSDHAGVLSDVASKPIFIEIPDNRSNLAQIFEINHFMVIDAQSTIFVSKPLAQKLHWVSGVKFAEIP
ncbi:MAG: FAD:protein FMN transferase, partial [Methylotenera sp.]